MVSYTKIGAGPWRFEVKTTEGTDATDAHIAISAALITNDLLRQMMVQLNAMNARLEDQTRLLVRMDRRSSRKMEAKS